MVTTVLSANAVITTFCRMFSCKHGQSFSFSFVHHVTYYT